MNVRASIGGKELTTDSISPEKEVIAHARELESLIVCGFRVQWLSGASGNRRVELDAGAGMGSKWLTLTIWEDDKTVYQGAIDMDQFAQDWVRAVTP